MLKQIFILLFLLSLSICAFAQDSKTAVPVKWERYAVKDKEVSILMPKLPVLISSQNVCSEKETNIYAAYAEEVVYTLIIVSKLKWKDRDYCPEKKDFDKRTFDERLKELQNSSDKIDEAKYRQKEREVFKIRTAMKTYWLINDFENKRWFEIATTHRSDVKPETKDFVESIQFEKNPAGIEIGQGAAQMLGDYKEVPVKETQVVGVGEGSGTAISNNTKQNSDKGVLSKVFVVHRPQPRYTDAARQNNVQGTVTLRVTFMANGGIGSVSPVSGLPFGLTEQAIIAAKKLVFLPAKRNNTTVSTIMTVSYSFTIY